MGFQRVPIPKIIFKSEWIQIKVGVNLLKSKRPQLDAFLYPLAEVAFLLSTTSKELLKAASRGEFRVFIRVPDGVDVYSIHRHAIDVYDLAVSQKKAYRRLSLPDEYEARPYSMEQSQIEGFILGKLDCGDVLEKHISRQYLFQLGVKAHWSGVEYVEPKKPIFQEKSSTLDPREWCLAVYGKDAPIEYLGSRGYSKPFGIELSIDKLFVTVDDIQSLMDRLDVNIYVEDLFTDGHVVTDRAAYFSKKLKYLIALAKSVWGEADPRGGVSRDKEKIVTDALADVAFQKLCANESPSKGVQSFGAQWITPIFARWNPSKDERELYPSYITPEIKALMAAAKWLWGGSDVMLDDPSTHPSSKQILAYLGVLGFKGDERKYASTIIRPEEAALGSQSPNRRKKNMK